MCGVASAMRPRVPVCGERCRTSQAPWTVPGAPDYALTRYAPRPPEETERETPTPRPRGGGQAERTRETLERELRRERLERDLTTLRDFHDHNAFSTNH